MKSTIECPSEYVNHDFMWISAYMGEMREIFRGFELGEIPKGENRKFAKRGIHYLDVARKRLDEIRTELEFKNFKLMQD